ncbi:Hsp70 family protein [Halobaculum sp. MBLA0147]|uniref:Hsp70 family protein n=1 Tax=Halobaculum sp. MBLA0147 TaxID=3079934 RepID=UPI0035258065
MTSIGIDLGTTNTAAAEKVGDLPKVVDFQGERTMRSVVAFTEGDDEVIVGNDAVGYVETDPEATFESFKREMGTDTTYAVPDGYTISEFTPEMLSALVLRKAVATAEQSLGSEVDSAVVTVPADFPEPARRATERAAEYADLEVLRLLPEPSAACAAYGLREREDPIETVAVYDLGGGTFDISVVEIVPEADLYEVQGTDGRQQLGGDDFDERLVEHVASEFEAETGIDLLDDHQDRERLRQAAKSVKHKLSNADEAEVRVPFVRPDTNLEQTVTRETFEDLTADLVDETIDVCEGLFEQLSVGVDDVDTVLLVGGSSKMPQIETAVEEFFGLEPSKEVNPDEAVAMGAAEQAAVISGRSGLDPDTEDSEGLDGGGILGVAPDPIGIRVHDGSFSRIIDDNETLPVRAVEDGYSTIEDGQEKASIEVYQGESDVAEENEAIGSFVLDNIRDAPAGVPNIAVELELDESGVLRPRAWDESVGEEAGAGLDDGVEISHDEAESEADVAAIRDDLPTVK